MTKPGTLQSKAMASQKLFCGLSGSCSPNMSADDTLPASQASQTRDVSRFMRPGFIDGSQGSARVHSVYDRLGVSDSTNGAELKGSKAGHPKQPEPAPAKLNGPPTVSL
jgi:hypothetical protein